MKQFKISNIVFRRMFPANILLAGAALATTCLGTPAEAQLFQDREYRVGNLIESGDFADPKGWKLEGFHVEKATGSISRKGEDARVGTASTTFQGPDGFYKIRVHYQDEGDGVTRAALAVGGKTLGTWFFDGILVTTFRWKEFDGVKINKGDEIVLSGWKSATEYCRISGIEILPSKSRAAVPDATAVERKEYSMDLVPVSGHPSVKNSREYMVHSNPLFTGNPGAFWVYLNKEEPLRLTARASHAGGNPSLRYSLTKAGADKPLAEETFVSESDMPIIMDVDHGSDGLHELKIDSAPGDKNRILINFDTPGVRTEGLNEGYFFVPKGTKYLSAKARNNIILIDSDGRVIFDDWFDGEATPVVEVPEGSDGQIWYFQGSISNLTGVPPYLAARRDALLVPEEVLQ